MLTIRHAATTFVGLLFAVVATVPAHADLGDDDPVTCARLPYHPVAVDERARGNGLGLRLVQAALEWAGNSRCTRVELKVLGSNSPAICVYTQAGFAESERTPGKFTIEGRGVDDVTMIRDLGRGSSEEAELFVKEVSK